MKKERKQKVIATNQRCLHAFIVCTRISGGNFIKDNFTAWHNRANYVQNFTLIDDKRDPDNPATHVEFGEQKLMPFVGVIAALALCCPAFLQ